MAFEFKLPDVGEGLHEAELLKWLVSEGDYVREDQPLMEVQTDKAAVEITAPTAGRIARLLGKPGEILQVHSVVAIFDEGSGSGASAQSGESGVATLVAAAPAITTAPPVAAPAAALLQPASPAVPQAAPAPGSHRALAAPATRKFARELGIEINRVPGSGPAGRVTREDLLRFVAGPASPAQVATAPVSAASAAMPAPAAAAVPFAVPAPEPATRPATGSAPGTQDERLPLKGIRKVIADAMVRSKHTAPHVTIVDEVEMTELSAFREKVKEMAAKKGVKVSYMPFIFKALTVALKEFPYLNAQIDDQRQEIVLRKQYHMGFALDTEAGLLVPVVKDVDRKSVFQIAAEMQTLIEKGRAGKLPPDDMKGSTFSVSNQGSIGGLFFTPVINHPEVAILGVGQTQERPVARDGQIVIRKMAYLSLSFDHRLIDGGMATRFLSRVIELLTNPTLLMMEAM